MKTIKVSLVSILILTSLSACAANEKKDLIFAMKEYTQPHGFTVSDYTFLEGSPVPTLTFEPYKSKDEYASTPLVMSYADGSKVEECMPNYERPDYTINTAKVIKNAGSTYYMHLDKGLKFNTYLYYTYKNGVCYILEGDAKLDPKLKSNQSIKLDDFYTGMLEIYSSNPFKKK